VRLVRGEGQGVMDLLPCTCDEGACACRGAEGDQEAEVLAALPALGLYVLAPDPLDELRDAVERLRAASERVARVLAGTPHAATAAHLLAAICALPELRGAEVIQLEPRRPARSPARRSR